jgi:hypothetical protein
MSPSTYLDYAIAARKTPHIRQYKALEHLPYLDMP